MANEDYGEFLTTPQVAVLLGYNQVTLRRWRTKNKEAGEIRYGPPYEIRGGRVLYPKRGFYTWCSQVRVVGGVPRMNLPVTAAPAFAVALQQRSAVKEADDVQA